MNRMFFFQHWLCVSNWQLLETWIFGCLGNRAQTYQATHIHTNMHTWLHTSPSKACSTFVKQNINVRHLWCLNTSSVGGSCRFTCFSKSVYQMFQRTGQIIQHPEVFQLWSLRMSSSVVADYFELLVIQVLGVCNYTGTLSINYVIISPHLWVCFLHFQCRCCALVRYLTVVMPIYV